VVTELGSLSAVTPREIENLFAADLAFLQDLYGVVNFGSTADVRAFLKEANEAEKATAARSRAQSIDEDDSDDDEYDDDDLDDSTDDDQDDEYEDDDEDEEIIISGRRRGGAVIEEVNQDS
jgi:hypothetical protein